MRRRRIHLALVLAAAAMLAAAVVALRPGSAEPAAAAARGDRRAVEGGPTESGGRAEVVATEMPPATSEARPSETAAELEDAATPASSLTVVVVDQDGAPIEGARLAASRRGWSSPYARASTDVRGVARVVDPREGDEWRVSTDGYLEHVETLGEPPWSEPYEVALGRGAVVLRGVVVGDRGETVANAHVEATDGARTWRATSDERGEFDLCARAALALPDELVWHVEAEGYCFLPGGIATALPRRPSTGRVLVPLARWARLDVRAVDGAGAPVTGARLRLLGAPDLPAAQRAWVAGGSHDAIAVGRAVGTSLALDRVPPIVSLWLEASHPRLGRREIELGALEPGETRELTVAFDGVASCGALRLRVVDSERRPVPRGRVRVAWGDEASASALWLDLDAEGRCAIEPPASEWRIDVLAPAFAPLRASFDALAVPAGEVEIALERSHDAIDVTIVDASGAGVAGALVELIAERGPLGARISRRTDGSGLARFEGVDASGTYRVVLGAGAPGAYYLPESVAALVPDPPQHRGVASGRAVRFRLVAAASIEGRVAACAGSRIHASGFESLDSAPSPAFTVGVECDAGGEFRLGGLPPGRYRVWSSAAASSLDAPLAVVDVAPGEVRALALDR